jgi:hypothetical protein
MDPDPHAERRTLRPSVRCERPLCRYGAGDRVVGSRKGIEEGVTLCVHFTAVVLRECGAEKASVFGQGVRIALAESVEQAGGSLDVRAKEADRPRR